MGVINPSLDHGLGAKVTRLGAIGHDTPRLEIRVGVVLPWPELIAMIIL
jgi:hypothetical protein